MPLAVVLEYRPGDPEPVHLRFLGDDVRDVVYPFGSYKSFESFGPAQPLYYGQTHVPEGTSFRDALVALYHSTDGANWNNNRNWLSDEPLDEWFGVTTDDDGLVIELDLSQNQLTGEIPAEIGRLTDLQDLDLFGNQLRGEIPPEIGSLANVTRLALWANQLTGEIPAELANLTNLRRLFLAGSNQFTGCVPAIWQDVPDSDLDEIDLPFCGAEDQTE